MVASGYPDYTKLMRRLGRTVGVWAVVFVAFILAAATVGAGSIVLVIGTGVLVTVVFAATAFQAISWVKETERLQHGDRLAARQRGRDDTRVGRPTTRLLAFAFSFIGALGLPLTIVGAIAHLIGLVIAGVALLVVEVLDLAVMAPRRRTRE